MFRAIVVILFSTLILLQVDVAPVSAQSTESQPEKKQSFFSKMRPKFNWKRPRFRNPFSRKAKKSNIAEKAPGDEQSDVKRLSGKRFADQTEPNSEMPKDRKKNSRVEMARKKNSGVRHADTGDAELERSPIRQTRFADENERGSGRDKRREGKSLSHQERVYQDILKKSESMSPIKLSEGIPYNENEGTKLSEVDPFTQPERRDAEAPTRRSRRSKQNQSLDDSELDEFMSDSRPQRENAGRRTARQNAGRSTRHQRETRQHTRSDDDADFELGREREEEFTSMPPRPRHLRRQNQPVEQRPRSIEEIERSLAEEEKRVGTKPRRRSGQNSPAKQMPTRRRSSTDDEFAELGDGFDDLEPERKPRQQEKSLRRRLSTNTDDLESNGSPFDHRSRFSKLKKDETSAPGLSDEWNNNETVPTQRSRRHEPTNPRNSKRSRFESTESDFDLLNDESTTNIRKTTTRFAETEKSSSRQRKTSRFLDDDDSSRRSRYGSSSQFDSTGSDSGYTTGGYSSFGTGRSFGSSRTTSGSSSRSSRRR